MSITTRTITATIFDNDGTALENARVEITLRGLGNEPGGAVSPGTQVQLTNSSGVATFELWQNNGTYSNTYYEISSSNPVNGVSIHRREKFIVPDHDADVKDLLAMTLAGVDPNQQLLDEIREAMAGAVDAAETATEKADAATTQAGTATTQAGVATTQAGIATNAANTATNALTDIGDLVTQASGFATSAGNSANTATTQSGIATNAANTAAEQAGISTTQAGISTTKAGEASGFATTAEGHKNSAASSANTATTQAGIATGAAGTATTQAGIATDGANTATTKASESNASKLLAEAAALLAQKWATEAENTPVTGGLYSAYHWAKKAEALVVGATEGAIVEINGQTGASVTLTYSHVGAASAAQGALADSAIQPSDLSTALSDYVESASLTTTLLDYVTVTGLSTALGNYYTKTEMDTALSGKATSAQGAKADTALQPGAIETNALVLEAYELALAGSVT